MNEDLTRRAWLAGVAGGLAMTTASGAETKPADRPPGTFGFCLNTSTVRHNDGQWGKSRPITELIDIASKAGYQAIEPWISELDAYVKDGGSLKDLGKRIADAGLKVPDAIGFAEWIVEDDGRRKKGLEQAKRDMDTVAQVGGTRLAAPPVGATGGTSRRDDPKFSQPIVDLLAAADRYRALLELGKSMGVTPVVEVWGFSKTLKRLGEVVLVAAECGSPEGCVLPDVYHLYKGGSDFAGLHLLGPAAIGIFHVNDYPKIDREKIVDADRVYPGDGVAPLKEVFATLKAMGYRGYVSLELFNREYWKQDPLLVAKTGLEKMKAVAGA
ncbi:MAG: sugar phosphate isomerase/epimerase [Gemmataceae bacterium]|nr:sugar phosphate isomerase/epimerase [Gemmataceae bacterium]